MFNTDLNNGKTGERLVASLLSEYGEFQVMEGYFPDYDLKGPFTVEVKTDIFSPKSGNVAIEYQHKGGELSGISRTKAQYYTIIAYDKNYSQVDQGYRKDGWWIGFLIKTQTLKDHLKDHIGYRRILGGDNKAMKMILVPTTHLYEIAEEIFPIKSYAQSL